MDPRTPESRAGRPARNFRPSATQWLLRSCKVLLAIACLSCTAPALAYEIGPLVSLLVKKGLITEEEAEELRAELAMEFAETPAGKIDVADDVKHLQFKSDLRTRYQYESTTIDPDLEALDRSRWRYRLKLGVDYQFTRGWSTGVQMETAEVSDSTNTDFGGYFDKDRDGTFVSQAYIDYNQPRSWAQLTNLTIGKKKHPFLIDPGFWDSDTNPEGFTGQLGWQFNGDDWLTLRAGTYLIDEAREGIAGNGSDDWLFMGQAEYTRYLGFRSNLRIAPMILAETDGDTSVLTAEGGNTPTNENAINYFGNMMAVSLPIEVNFLVGNLPQQLSLTAGYNLHADDAVNDPSSPYRPDDAPPGARFSGDGLFYNVRYMLGGPKYFKEWSLGLEYRYLGNASMTPNLTDSDFGKNRLNQSGFLVYGTYMLSNSVRLTSTYMNSKAIDGDWYSEVADIDDSEILMLDLQAKF